MALRPWDEIRQSAIEGPPAQGCATFYVLKGMMDAHGFIDLKTLITTPYSKGGLGMTLDKAMQLINFNPDYEYYAKQVMQKLGVAEWAKNSDALHASGDQQYSGCDKSEHVTGYDRGNAAKYCRATLKREPPAIAERLEQGQFTCVSQAVDKGQAIRSDAERVVSAYKGLGDHDQQAVLNAILELRLLFGE